MPNTAEQAIYNRLASAPTFHPASVKLLPTDWTLEPGDVVTVKSGETSYSVPVYSMDLTWNANSQSGTCESATTRISVESTGGQTREPLPELQRKQFEQDRYAYTNFKEQKQEVDEHWQHIVNVTDQGMSDCFSIVGVSIDQTTGLPKKDGDNYIWYENDPSATREYGEIWGHLHRDAWTQVIQNNITGEDGTILSIGQVLTSADGQVLITAINDQQTGTATINANRILINGDMTLNGAMSSDSGMLWIKVAAKFGSAGGQMVTINNGKVNASELQVNSGGALKIVGSSSGSGAPQTYSLGYSDFSNFMTSIGTPTISNTGQFTVPYYSLGVPDGSGGSQAGTINITHYHDITATEGIGTDAGKVFFTSGAVRSTAGTTNFNIAATQFFRDSVAAAWTTATGYVALPSAPQSPTNEFAFSYPIYVPSTGASGQDSTTYELSQGSWDSSYQRIVTVTEQGESDIIAQTTVDASTVYIAGQNSVDVTKGNWNGGIISFTPSAGTGGSQSVQLAQGSASWNGNTATVPILDGSDSTGLSVEVDASGLVSAVQQSGSIAINADNPPTYYGSTTPRSIACSVIGTLTNGNSIGGTVLIEGGAVQDAYDDGFADCHLSYEWGTGANANRLIIGKTTSGSANSLSFDVTAGASIDYDSTTHKYTATGKAYVNSVQKDSDTAESGTEAYGDGWGAARTSVGEFPDSTPQTLPDSITVKKPSLTVGGEAVPYAYTLAVDNSFVYLKNGINPVARISNPAFANGKAAHTATSAGTVTLTSSDTGSSVSKTTTVTYSNGETTANVPITIDASEVYAAGQAASTFDIRKLRINLGNDSDPTAQVPSKTTDRQNNKVLVSGKIGVWYDGTYIGELREFSFSVGYGTPYINNHAQGYVRGAVTINGDTITGTAIKLTESQISSWGGPIT